MSNPTPLAISQLENGGAVRTSDQIPIARNNGTFKAAITFKPSGGLKDELDLGFSVAPQDFIDGTTITYNPETGKISSVGGGSSGVASIVSGQGITTNSATGNVTISAKIKSGTGLLLNNEGISLSYNTTDFSIINNSLSFNTASNASKFNSLALQPSKIIATNSAGDGFVLIDIPSGAGILSINGVATALQYFNTENGSCLAYSHDPATGIHLLKINIGDNSALLVSGGILNVNADNSTLFIQNNQLKIKNSNLLSIASLSLASQSGKAIVVNSTNDGFALASVLSSIPLAIDSAVSINTSVVRLVAGTNITLSQTPEGVITINAESQGGSYTAGNGIEISNNIISAKIALNSALIINNGFLDCKTNINQIANLDLQTASLYSVLTVLEGATTGSRELAFSPPLVYTRINNERPDQAVLDSAVWLFEGAGIQISRVGPGAIQIAATGGGAGVSSFKGSQVDSQARVGAVTASVGDYNATIIKMDDTDGSNLLSTVIDTINSQLITNVTISGGNVTGQGNITNNQLTLNLNAPTVAGSNSTYFSSAQLIGSNALGSSLNYTDNSSVLVSYRCILLNANASFSGMNFIVAEATSTKKIQLNIGIQCFADNTLASTTNITSEYKLYAFNTTTNSFASIDTGNFNFAINAKDNKTFNLTTNQVVIGINTIQFVLVIQNIQGSSGHIGVLGITISPTLS